MKNLKKKGFTIVELVIVIAVIAILSAVLIPTFSNLIRKANISSDTVLGRNLNTALNVYEVENGVDSFEDVLDTLKENGYLIANLNAKADGCYFVWESKSNQILLVDSKNNYEVLFSIKEYEPIGETWYFAISDITLAAEVSSFNSSVNVMKTVGTVEDLKTALNSNVDQEIYIDESILLTNKNAILIDNDSDAVITLNLVNSLITSEENLENAFPFEIKNGNVKIIGGTIGAAGEYIDADGRLVNSPIQTYDIANVEIQDTHFITNDSGYTYFGGNTVIKNATFTAGNIGIYAGWKVNLTLEDSKIKSAGRCIWSCSHGDNGVATVKSGVYEGGSEAWAAFVTCGGHINIEGGEFITSNKFFEIFANGGASYNMNSKITITGGTFNGKPFNEITTEAEWLSMCKQTAGYNHVVSIETGKVIISLEKAS